MKVGNRHACSLSTNKKRKIMNLKQATYLRKLCGIIIAVLFFMVLLSILDGFIAKFTSSINVLNLLPAQTAKLNGYLEDKSIKNPDRLNYTINSKFIKLNFIDFQTDYWFGSNMWRGVVTVDNSITSGIYDLKVYVKGETTLKPTSVFKINVYKDHESYRKSFKSVIQRNLGISPWWLTIGIFLLILPGCGVIFYLSNKIEYIMAQQGKAELYRVINVDNGMEIYFGLGTKHGIKAGMKFFLNDEKEHTIGIIEVSEASETDSCALWQEDIPVKIGYIVSLLK